jgi:LysM repeat protein
MATISTLTGEVIDSSGGKKSTTQGNSTVNTGGSKTSGGTTSKKDDSKAKSTAKKKAEDTANSYVEATLNTLPNPDISVRQIYGIRGVGKAFTGLYYTKTVTHTIADVYTVSAEVLMVQKNIPTKTGRSSVSTKKKVKSQDNPKFQIITIKRGDTLSSLAEKYQCSVDYLASINGIKDANKISAGKKIKVPA